MKSAGLDPRYEVLGELGAGRHTIVIRVRDRASGHIRALKALRDPDPEREEALGAEFLLLRDLDHPFFPRAFDYRRAPDGRAGFTMTCIDAPALSDLAGSHAAERLPEILHDACLALRVLHRRGLLHADVKPQNIKVMSGNARPAVRILDLGLARPGYRGEARRIRGTAPYLAPEILRGERVDPRADIYALGVSIHAALSGRAPFEGKADEVVAQILSEGLPAVHRVYDGLPGPLAALIDAMTARRPADRPRDVEDVIRRLDAAGHPSPGISRGAGEFYLLSPPPAGGDDGLPPGLPEPTGAPGRSGLHIHVISGRPGTGRTRRLRAVRSRLQRRGFLTVGCPDEAPGCGAPGLSGLAADAGVPSDGDSAGGGETEVESIHDRKRRLAAALEGRPVAFFLAGVERFDTPSRVALAELLRELAPGGPLCFVVAGEGAENGGGTDGLGRLLEGDDPAVRARTVETLGALSLEGTGHFIDALLGDVQGREVLVGEIHRWTSGACEPTREVLAGLAERGGLRFRRGEWESDPASLAAQAALGPIGSVAAARAALLTRAERELLRTASILGVEFRLDDLRALRGRAGEDERIPGEGLDRLFAPGAALRRVGEGRARFRDGALREHLHASIPAERRRALHGRVLEVLAERKAVVPPLVLAIHHHEAGNVAEAISRYREGALAAARVEDLLAARRGLGALARSAREEGRADFDLEAALGDVLFEWREFSAAAEAYDRAAEIAARGGEGAARLEEIRIRKARCLIQTNRLDEALVRLREIGARVGWRTGDPRTGRIQREIGWIHYRRGRYREALRFYRRCLASARRAGDATTVLHLCNDIAVVHVERGEWGRAERWTARAKRGGEAAGQVLIVANAYSIRGWSRRLRARYDAALACQQKALEGYRRLGASYDMARTSNNLGQLYRDRGELDRAILYLERALFLSELYPLTTQRAHTITNLGLLQRSLGRFDRSRALLRGGIELFLRCGDRDDAAIVCGDLLETCIAAGHPGEAMALLREQRRYARGTEKPYVRARRLRAEGLVALAAGRCDRAARRLGRAAAEFREIRHPKNAIRARKDRARALLAGDRPGEAEREATAALEAAREIGSLELEVESGLVVASAWERLGRTEEATARFQAILDRIAETPYRRLRAEALRGVAGCLHRRRVWRRRGAVAAHFDACVLEAENLYREMGLTERWKEGRRMRKEADDSLRHVGGRELFTLYEAGRTINSTLSIDGVLERLMDLVVETMGVERAVVFLRDPVDGELRPAAARNVERETIEDAHTFSTTVLEAVGEAGRSLYIRDCRDDPACAESESISKYSILSVICVPLRDREERLGTIYVDDRRIRHLFTEEDVTFLASLADLAAVALRNARLHEALETTNARLREENLDLRRRERPGEGFHGLIGRHESMAVLRRVIERVAGTDASVLIRGENGTGKELVAHAVHEESPRRDAPFVVVNCAAIPESLLEAEIFGVEAGTATGVGARIGRFEQADGGTLFLDEVGDLIPAVQAKFLRVLQEKRFERVGGRRSLEVDVRILAATNKDLEAAMEAGRFREDLFYRLNTIPILVPPLRRRREDIPRLAAHFLQSWARENGRKPARIERAAMDALLRYDWPGNVRQLRNVMERMAVLGDGDRLGAGDVPLEITSARDAGRAPEPGSMAPLREVVRTHVRSVYRACGERKKRACEILGISYKTLRAHLDD